MQKYEKIKKQRLEIEKYFPTALFMKKKEKCFRLIVSGLCVHGYVRVQIFFFHKYILHIFAVSKNILLWTLKLNIWASN